MYTVKITRQEGKEEHVVEATNLTEKEFALFVLGYVGTCIGYLTRVRKYFNTWYNLYFEIRDKAVEVQDETKQY